ncbi:MAG: hypothetical protein JSV07_02865 [Acidimicrobiia bacterium]|nr:MAG: hypothetical protein JSV07_02865 [Acidimicrobiia bacterium]
MGRRHPDSIRHYARRLRREGRSYREIAAETGVPRGTVVSWCMDIPVPEEVAAETRARTHPSGVARNTQWRRREQIDEIRAEARGEVRRWEDSPWVAGVLLYWGEGDKTSNAIGMSNSDPALLRYFISWCRRYLDPDAEFVLKLNLHADNDEAAARCWWESELGLPNTQFHKTYLKPNGTGHRKNTLHHGVYQVRMRRSTDAFHRTMGWTEGPRAHSHFAYQG